MSNIAVIFAGGKGVRMEPKNPEQEKDKKEEEKAPAQSSPPNTTNCPSDPKQKGFAPKCQGCPFRAQCQQGAQAQGPSIDEQVKEKLVNVRNIILVLSGKGGVGKSKYPFFSFV